ncbi:MAG: hypothetical protein FWC87_05855 [Acidimicrobiaceae bacterium]|nr:hypothetical protein [Acidimicrobiaceae bacterium]
MARIRDGKFSPLQIKLAWSALFLWCFLAGRHIPIPYLHDVAKGSAANAELLNAANIATGGNFFSPSLFSLGLGPWMEAMILWRFLFIAKIARDHKIPEQTVNRARNLVMVALAVFQATSLMSRYEIGSLSVGPFSDRVNAKIIIVAFLIAGAIAVSWLAQKNADLGLGGITMFVLYQVIISAMQNRGVLSVAASNPRDLRVLAVVILACVCVGGVGVIAANAEMRLHVNKISIDSGYTGKSYLPIKLNPAGASPIMYALTLLALPQYFAHTVSAVVPATTAGVNRFLSVWGLTNPVGFSVYLLLLFGMTIFFGLFTVGTRAVAERMQKTGEYFDHVPPGRATRRYLRRHVVLLSSLSGVFLVIFTGVPLHFIGSYPNLQYLLTAPATLLILLGVLWLLYEEVGDTVLGTKYVFAFKTASGKASSTKSSSSGALA